MATITSFTKDRILELVNPTALISAKVAPTYSPSITPNAQSGNWQTITVPNTSAFTINAPSNPPSASGTQELTIEIYNNSGDVMGTISWNIAFVWAGYTWANPTSTKKRWARFQWNGAKWICVGVAQAEY